jgi:leader peptidase (prepilin peptidase)/N-methyltransferase
MGTVLQVAAALLGACIGSFLNVVIFRLQQEDPARRSLGGRSHCPHCGAAIRWQHNVPVLGWLVLRGKGACCKRPISLRYPLVEALTAALFWALVAWPARPLFVEPAGSVTWLLDGVATFVALALFVSLLVALSFIDFDTQLLPDALTKPGIALGLLAGLWPGVAGQLGDDPAMAPALRSLLASGLGALVGFGVTWGIRALGGWVFRREAMGFGDVKLMAMIGAFLGWQKALLAMLLGCLFGALLGGLGTLLGGATKIPFGPYLALGAIVAHLAYGPIVTFLFDTWPTWQRERASAQWLLAGGATVSLVLMLVLVRRARRRPPR